MREVEVILAALDYQVDKLLHIWVITLQIEGNQLRNVELEILSHR